MMEIIEVIFSTFQNSKEKGSFPLFYLLALGLGLAIAWDRYGKTKPEDNWMVEEAKKQIQLWPFLYGMLALVLVVMNPVSIGIYHKLTPVLGQYYKTWGLLLFLFICAYGMVCFLSILREKNQRILVTFGFVFLIGIAGSGYGLTADRSDKKSFEEEAAVTQMIREQKEDALILATDSLLEYLGIYETGM